jgi:tripartite-type tricarboxylate transporter receptor subunit TctC
MEVMKKMKRLIFISFIIIFCVGTVNFTLAQDDNFPTKPITFIVTSGAGGMTDASARILADKLQKVVGQPIAVVNKTGGGGLVGLNEFANSRLDPHQVCITTTAHLNAAPFLGAEDFDLEQLKFVCSYMPQERVLYANADDPYKTWEEFVDYAKENPGEVSVGSGNAQWALDVLKVIGKNENLDMNYILYESGGEASNDIIGGHVDVAETGVGTPAYQAARAGDLNIILNLGPGSVPRFPDVPNVIQKGYPYYSRLEYGVCLQAGVSEEIREFWEDAFLQAMEDFGVLQKFIELGLVPRFLPGNLWKEVAEEHVRIAYELVEFVE